ncbi:hypothetical protein [Natrinema sp. SYSU A 869]|uniref:DUF7282 domain-containing protein n=1 Tax=Natrinema sp. SYSU A 869 TaxID=2871694 RepID=UPI001CA42F04|nr:hypothetical protein [Natrinema sp. SYSU A 869]
MVTMPRARTIGVAVITALVLLSGASIVFAATDAGMAIQDNETENETENATENETANETENETATVTFENQTSNGTAVGVNNTTLPEGGFAVIHAAAPVDEDNMTDNATDENATDNMTADDNETVTNMSEEYEPGAVLGNSTYLDPGEHENVTVELNESLDDSQVLIAMAHQDTNDNQTYEFPEADGPYTSDGEPVIDDALITLEEEQNETQQNETTG